MTYRVGVANIKQKEMSFVQVMSHSGGSLASDRTPFYGIKLPPEVKSTIKLCKTVEHGTVREILKGRQS